MLQRLKAALETLTDKVYRYIPETNIDTDFIVWREEGSVDLLADNVHAEAGFRGSVDLFVRDDASPLIAAVPAALQNLGLCWYLELVQYETDTRLLHYTWAWEMC